MAKSVFVDALPVVTVVCSQRSNGSRDVALHKRGRLMRRRIKTLLAASIVCVIVAIVYFLPRMPSVASRALDSADRYELLSLDPAPVDEPSPELFRGRRILGSVVISDPAARSRLSNSLRGSVVYAWQVPRCFSPRHAIRVTHGAKVTDFLICFECRQVEVWEDRQKIGYWVTGNAPQYLLDEILHAAGVSVDVKN